MVFCTVFRARQIKQFRGIFLEGRHTEPRFTVVEQHAIPWFIWSGNQALSFTWASTRQSLDRTCRPPWSTGISVSQGDSTRFGTHCRNTTRGRGSEHLAASQCSESSGPPTWKANNRQWNRSLVRQFIKGLSPLPQEADTPLQSRDNYMIRHKTTVMSMHVKLYTNTDLPENVANGPKLQDTRRMALKLTKIWLIALNLGTFIEMETCGLTRSSDNYRRQNHWV